MVSNLSCPALQLVSTSIAEAARAVERKTVWCLLLTLLARIPQTLMAFSSHGLGFVQGMVSMLLLHLPLGLQLMPHMKHARKHLTIEWVLMLHRLSQV